MIERFVSLVVTKGCHLQDPVKNFYETVADIVPEAIVCVFMKLCIFQVVTSVKLLLSSHWK